MGGFVNSVEMKLLDHFTGKTAYTAPTWYVALSTTLPTEGSGNFTEPTNGGYIRPELTAGTWTAASGGDPSSTSYGGAITFAQATGGWGTVTYFGLFSVKTQTTGLAQFWGTLTTPKAIQTSDTASFAANTLFVKLGDPPDTY
jgi:hypothetical protein